MESLLLLKKNLSYPLTKPIPKSKGHCRVVAACKIATNSPYFYEGVLLALSQFER